MPSSRLGPGHPLSLVSTWPPTVTPVSGAARVTHPGTPQPPPVPPRLPGQSWLLQQEGAPSLPPLERGGARWGGTTHEFRKPVWSHAGWKERRKEALEVPGFAACGRGPRRQGHVLSGLATPQPRPLSSHQEQKPLESSGHGRTAASRTGQGWTGTTGGPTPRQDGPRTEVSTQCLPTPSSPPPTLQALFTGAAYGTRAHRCPCRS